MSKEYIKRLSIVVRLNKWKSDIADTYGKNDEYVRCIEDVIGIVDSIPEVEAEPIRHREWIVESVNIVGETIVCSECSHKRTLLNPVYKHPNYCENCNAKMDGKENKNETD